MDKILKNLSKIPHKIRVFLLKVFALFLFWKIAYGFFLGPSRIIDNYLTSKVGKDVVWVLKNGTKDAGFTSNETLKEDLFEGQLRKSYVTQIKYKGVNLIHIADGCNGLELFILYAGFIVAIPSPIKRKIIFAIFGVLLIHIVNILRCIGLVFIAINWRDQFEFAHHYLFKFTIYAIIFFLWAKFIDNAIKKEERDFAV